jgi:hypothetical protein
MSYLILVKRSLIPAGRLGATGATGAAYLIERPYIQERKVIIKRW